MEEKFRVAMFGQKRLSREGGIEIVVKELCTRMAQAGCQVTCYASMCENVDCIGVKLRSGGYFMAALDESLRILSYFRKITFLYNK